MTEVRGIDYKALMQVTACWREGRLKSQQFKTLRGQVLAGDADGALRGLRKILNRQQGSGSA